ncbi:coiled-coil domain-containing protein 24 isoform X2 [Carettochelys insculpta]|uniref:coiled-coil domain-containing protein 24 isoform X2 n=1 Tax=Carettochelys insculpta TaxID=44489 RepID=UPI003EB7A0A3
MFPAPCGDGQPLPQLPSLWRWVEEQVGPSEAPEVATLGELWQEVRSASAQLNRCPPRGAGGWALLTTPPHLKELMRRELQLLLLSLQQKASEEGRDAAAAIAKYSPHVVSFALGPSAGGDHAGQDKCPPVATSTRPGTSLIHHLEPLKGQLSVSRIHQARPQIRALLEEECRALERHVCHLQHCLEEDHRAAEGPIQPAQEPTMAELQEQRRAMEQDLQWGWAEPRLDLSQENQCPGPAAPQQCSCPGSLGAPAPARAPHRLAPATSSLLGTREPAPGTMLGPAPPMGSLAGALAGWVHGQGQTDGDAECQDLGVPPPRRAGLPPASLVPTAPGQGLAFLPSPPLQPRPCSCLRLRLLGCQAPG